LAHFPNSITIPNQMERWAADTLRILGIIVTAIILVCGCLLLVLLGQCASQGNRNPPAATNYYFGAVLLALVGITLIAVLARGVFRSSALSPSTSAQDQSLPWIPVATSVGKLSPASRRVIHLLTWAVIARIVVSALELVYNILRYRQMPRMPHSIVQVTTISSAVFALPFVLILYFVRRRLSRSVLAFALGIPAAEILMTLIATVPLLHVYVHSTANLATLVIPFIVDLVILAFAYQAEQRIGLKLPASSLLTALVVSFAYFYSLRLVTQFLYRNFLR